MSNSSTSSNPIIKHRAGLLNLAHLQELYQIAFRKKIYDNLQSLQADLDDWLVYYNNERTHQGKMCCGRTPMQTLTEGKSVWAEKNLAQI